jgi:hypothetical protein
MGAVIVAAFTKGGGWVFKAARFRQRQTTGALAAGQRGPRS